MKTRKGMRKSTEEKYLNVFNQIFHAVRINPNINVNDICVNNGVTHNLASMMKKVGIIQDTKNGVLWIDVPPNIKQVKRIHDYRTKQNEKYRLKNNQTDLFTSIKNEKTTEPIKRKRKVVISQENVQKDIVLTDNYSFEVKVFGVSIIKIAR